ncbi:MAG TPA: hypothetical protein VK211_07325 [Kamptonema sp.]|nr:hypothetical protein [Kamptonema sp.]
MTSQLGGKKEMIFGVGCKVVGALAVGHSGGEMGGAIAQVPVMYF